MELVGRSFSLGFEAPLMEWLQTHISSGGIEVISRFSLLGEEVFLILILGFIYWARDKKMGRYIGFNILPAAILGTMFKNVFIRRRPYFDHDGIKILRIVEPEADAYDIAAQGFSFPSLHSTNSVSSYGSMAMYMRSVHPHTVLCRVCTVFAVIVPLLVGFSRVVVGAHYPTDVLCGWLLGGVTILLVPRIGHRVTSRKAQYIMLIVITLPGLFFCRSEDYFTTLGLMIGFIAGSVIEERYVNFENTDQLLPGILRVLGGLAIFLGLNTVLKLPFSESFLEGGTYASLLVRTLRYAVITLVDFGIYPLVFRKKGGKA